MENANIHRIDLGDRTIILIGTAHISRESVELVDRVITEEKPDTVCVELCGPRREAIAQQDKWHQTDIV
ncbi:MAG: TraB/GumN family protein, partial [Thermodesulfobacteriota bacterium]